MGDGCLLRRLLEARRLTSAIFAGPPGCGKTTLARLIAAHADAEFVSLHAAEVGVKEVRAVLESARGRLASSGRRTILFLDEIHRFSRSQQDVLLDDVETGVVILIGATTEPPTISVNAPLLSRSRVFEFHPLSADEIRTLLTRAIRDTERGIAGQNVRIDDDALTLIAQRANGDARRALEALEAAVALAKRDAHACVTSETAAEAMQCSLIRYDAGGDMHYDVASALIKSMRGSDPDAALYWLAVMLEGGEDPRFIARRIVIAASEDVGNADPQALVVATAAARAVEFVGLPECQFALAQAVVYVACALKSDAVTRAIAAARRDVRNEPLLPVPEHLRDASVRPRASGAAAYRSPHENADGFVAQDYLGAQRSYYNPSGRGAEREIARRLVELRTRLAAARRGDRDGER
ncbi:MAG: replication-associated recombination protein A [Planctomycetota bacterium]|nr:MAG: replication-associated recombination protein A [Planctomycetota bacterium]